MAPRHLAIAALAAAFAAPALGQDIAVLAPDDPAAAAAEPLAMTVSGQVPRLPGPSGAFRHEWPGVSAAAQFEGDAVLAYFDDPAGRYRLSIDGGAGQEVIRPGRRALRVAGLGPGRHTVTVAKLTETAGTFGGFAVPPGGTALPAPPPRARRIEVIGNSDAVGYGVTSPSRECGADDVFGTTDAQQAFGPRVARHFDADLRLAARSGIGIVRNYGGSPGPGMPEAHDAAPAGDGWSPQLIVLALGSNDFATELAPGEAWADAEALRAAYEAAFAAFLKSLRSRHPAAFLLVVRFEDYGGDYAEATAAAVARGRAEGDPRLELIAFPTLERTACHWHPSLDDHARMAETLIDYLDSRPAVWAP